MPHPVERLLEVNEEVVEILLVLKVSLTLLQYTYVSCLLYAPNNYHRFDFNCITLLSVSGLSCEKSQGIFG